MGYKQAEKVYAKDLLAEAQRMYHVFHIHVNETGYKDNPGVLGYWRDLLGERLLVLDDSNQIAELIASTVAVISGADIDDVASSFDAATADSVKKALVNVSKDLKKGGDSGVINL